MLQGAPPLRDAPFLLALDVDTVAKDLFVGNNGRYNANELWTFVRCPAGAALPSGGCATCDLWAHRPSAIGADRCVECPAFTQRDASGECTACAPGRERPFGSLQCSMCPVGSEWAEAGACSACNVGEYAGSNGTVACKACPSFSTTSAAGATSIGECDCGKGFFTQTTDGAGKVCVACPEGSTTAGAGSVSVNDCVCQQGRYFSRYSDGGATCPTCPEGSTTAGAGSTSVDQCLCGLGKYNLDGACTDCPIGTECILGADLSNLPVAGGFFRSVVNYVVSVVSAVGWKRASDTLTQPCCSLSHAPLLLPGSDRERRCERFRQGSVQDQLG